MIRRVLVAGLILGSAASPAGHVMAQEKKGAPEFKVGDIVLHGNATGEVKSVKPDGSLEVFVISPQYGNAVWPKDRVKLAGSVTPVRLRSNDLAKKYTPVPASLDTRGINYELPVF